MNPLLFTLAYLAIGLTLTALVWPLTNKKFAKKTNVLSSTVILNNIISLSNFGLGVFAPMQIEPDIPVRSFGLAVFSVGCFFAVWGKLAMRQEWGMPGQHDIGKQSKLVTHGPFQYSRNPIYLGLILMHFGSAIALKSAGILLVPLLYFHLDRQIKKEEILLTQHFEKSFHDYKMKVNRFL